MKIDPGRERHSGVFSLTYILQAPFQFLFEPEARFPCFSTRGTKTAHESHKSCSRRTDSVTSQNMFSRVVTPLSLRPVRQYVKIRPSRIKTCQAQKKAPSGGALVNYVKLETVNKGKLGFPGILRTEVISTIALAIFCPTA